MTTKQNELVIGAMMSLATLIVILGILWLGKSNVFVKGFTLNLLVENANGVSQGDEVYFRGLKVGTVRNAVLHDKHVLLDLKLEGVSRIPKDSKFTIRDYSLVGGKVVEILPGKSPEALSSGDTVFGYATLGMTDFVSELRSFEPQLKRILSNMDSITSPENIASLHIFLKELTATVRDIDQLVNGEIKSAATSINRLASDNGEKLKTLLESLEKSSHELKGFLSTSSNVAERLDTLLAKINNNKRTLSSIMQNDSLYRNLNHAIISIDSLVSEIKRKPDKYLKVNIL